MKKIIHLHVQVHIKNICGASCWCSLEKVAKFHLHLQPAALTIKKKRKRKRNKETGSLCSLHAFGHLNKISAWHVKYGMRATRVSLSDFKCVTKSGLCVMNCMASLYFSVIVSIGSS